MKRHGQPGLPSDEDLVSTADYLFQELDRHELEAQEADEGWTAEELKAISARIEEGSQQAERGELVDGDEARRRMQPLKEQFLKPRGLHPPSR